MTPMNSRFKLSDDEVRLFRDAVADARPLPAKPLRRRPKPRPQARFTRASQQEILEESMSGLPDPDEQIGRAHV